MTIKEVSLSNKYKLHEKGNDIGVRVSWGKGEAKYKMMRLLITLI